MKSIGKATEELFLETLKEQLSGCPRPVRVVCALSGGADSTLLLLLTAKYASFFDLIPEAAYVNHGIREAAVLAREDRKVSGLCSDLNIPFHKKQLSPGFLEWFAARKNIGTEAAARMYRYRFFEKILSLDDDSESRLALGHNRNDQEETVMMRLFSGSGIQGLRGIPRSSARIIRPLIDMDRSMIEAYLDERQQETIEDESNREDDYLRNRIRNRVLPFVREYFPQAGDAMRSLCSSMNDMLDHYEALLDKSCPWDFADGRYSCSIADFSDLPSVSRRMVVLGKRNLLLQGRDGAGRIPSAFLNPLDTLKGDNLLKGYGILFYKKKGRLVLEAEKKEEFDSYFFLLDKKNPFISPSCIFRFEERYTPESGRAEDLICPVDGSGALSIRKDGKGEGSVVLCHRGVELLSLSNGEIHPSKGIKIEKRNVSGGFRGLPCVIIEVRG